MIGDLNPAELHNRYGLGKSPVKRVDGGPVAPHAPPYTTHPLHIPTPANKLVDPTVKITDFGTSFIAANNTSPETNAPKLRTPALYLPPEGFFDDPATLAADVWTLGTTLYEVIGERPLFETFSWDHDDIICEMVNTLGQLPQRWWDKWANRGEFFEYDGSWQYGGVDRILTPAFRRLHQRMWHMGRGETPETCEWDVEGGEMRALEDLLKGMLVFEPDARLTAEQVLESEYMVKWALPAWERQVKRAVE